MGSNDNGPDTAYFPESIVVSINLPTKLKNGLSTDTTEQHATAARTNNNAYDRNNDYDVAWTHSPSSTNDD